MRYAGHIGTEDSPESDNSRQAKEAWRSAVREEQIAPEAAFNPVGRTLPAMKKLNIKKESAEFYGAFEPTSKVYTVVLTASKERAGNVRRIAKVVPMRTTPDVTAF